MEWPGSLRESEGKAMLKILDTIKQANVESITKHQLEYECDSCGTFHKHDEIEERPFRSRDTGEYQVALICPKCISLGWDRWGQ